MHDRLQRRPAVIGFGVGLAIAYRSLYVELTSPALVVHRFGRRQLAHRD